jgi:hypothetical protein
MEGKWVAIMVAVGIAAMMGVAGVGEWFKNSCKTEFAKTTRTVEEIREICR